MSCVNYLNIIYCLHMSVHVLWFAALQQEACCVCLHEKCFMNLKKR